MRDFSQSLQGDAKKWFKHLQPESISTWEEISNIFLEFWGERRPWDQILSACKEGYTRVNSWFSLSEMNTQKLI